MVHIEAVLVAQLDDRALVAGYVIAFDTGQEPKHGEEATQAQNL